MIIQLYKKTCMEEYNGNYTEMLNDGKYLFEWTDANIKGAFNFGRGTIADLRRYIDDNKTLSRFFNTETNAFIN